MHVKAEKTAEVYLLRKYNIDILRQFIAFAAFTISPTPSSMAEGR